MAGVSALSVLQCSDTVGRVIGKTLSQKNCTTYPHLEQVTAKVNNSQG